MTSVNTHDTPISEDDSEDGEKRATGPAAQPVNVAPLKPPSSTAKSIELVAGECRYERGASRLFPGAVRLTEVRLVPDVIEPMVEPKDNAGQFDHCDRDVTFPLRD
jgi:hypothetical protein